MGRSKVIPFTSALFGGDPIVNKGAPDDLETLLRGIHDVPADNQVEAAHLSAGNWASLEGLTWPKPPNNPLLWAVFPLDHDGPMDDQALVRQANWFALKDTLRDHDKWQAVFLRFKHPKGALYALGIQCMYPRLGVQPGTVTPAFRLFHRCLPQLQAGTVLDDEIFQECWQEEVVERIRILGSSHVHPAEQDTSMTLNGVMVPGWPDRVFTRMMQVSPEMLVASTGHLPNLTKEQVLGVMVLLGVDKDRQQSFHPIVYETP